MKAQAYIWYVKHFGNPDTASLLRRSKVIFYDSIKSGIFTSSNIFLQCFSPVQ